MVTNLNFNNGYGYFDTIFIYTGNTFLSSIVLCYLFKEAHVLAQPSSTASLVPYPQVTVKPYIQ